MRSDTEAIGSSYGIHICANQRHDRRYLAGTSHLHSAITIAEHNQQSHPSRRWLAQIERVLNRNDNLTSFHYDSWFRFEFVVLDEESQIRTCFHDFPNSLKPF